MNVGVYVRSATGDDAQLHDQERRCRDHAAERGWSVVAIWSDSGSGLSADRPGLCGLHDAIAARQIDGVVATDAARLGRNNVLVDRLVIAADGADIPVTFLDGPLGESRRSIVNARTCFRAIRPRRRSAVK